MRTTPDFSIELSQAIDFVFSSDIARKAFNNAPFDGFANILRDILVSIDRLADNCHMPEFTNHALPHICSMVKRASDWGVNDGWIDRISSYEAGLLLLALIVHDIGMLSQDADNLPDSDAINSRKGLSDLSNWTRQTHVIRLKKLLLSILDTSGHLTSTNKKHFILVAEMGASHSCWPTSQNFNCTVFKSTQIKKTNIMALCAVIAVVDLLDEDTNRCDTRTLINHKQGTTENIAHWIRHTLTVSVGEIKSGTVNIVLKQLSNTPSGFGDIYKALKNHYRLIRLYNAVLNNIDANIEDIYFADSDCTSFDEFAFWANLPEFKNNIPERILSTFMREALGSATSDISETLLKSIDVEKIARPTKDIQTALLTVDETAFMINKDFNYMRRRAEQAMLDGQIGVVRNISSFVFGKIDFSKDDISDWFWAPTYLLKYFAKEWEYKAVEHQLKRVLSTMTSDYAILLNSVLKFLADPIFLSKKDGSDISSSIYNIIGDDLSNSLSTDILIETVVELVWNFADFTVVMQIIDFIIKIYERMKYNKSFLTALKARIQTQESLFIGKLDKEHIITANKSEYLIAYAWSLVFGAKWDELEKSLEELSRTVDIHNQYFIPLQGLCNVFSGIISMSKGSYGGVENYNYYKYQRLILGSPLRVFEDKRESHINHLLRMIDINPTSTEAATSRKELFRIINLSTLSALKYWDMGSLSSMRKYEAELHISLGICFDDENNYRGYVSSCFKAIILSIYSTDTKFVDKISIQLNTCIALLDRYAPDLIREIYEYIFFYAKPIEILTACKIVSLLSDRIPEDMLDAFVDWIIRHYQFAKANPMFMNLKVFNYLIEILDNIKLSNKQYNKILPIFSDIISRRIFINQTRLYETFFFKTSPSASKKLINKAVDIHRHDIYELKTLAYAIFSTAIKRKSIHEQALVALNEINGINSNSECIQLIEWLNCRSVDKQTTFDFKVLCEKLKVALNSISTNGKNGVYSHYDHNDLISLCRNSNWKLAALDDREHFYIAITEFIKANNNNVSMDDLVALLKMLLGAVLRFEKSFKKRLVKFVIMLIDTNYQVSKGFSNTYSPISTFRFNNNISVLNIYLLIFGEFVSICDDEDKSWIMKWFNIEYPNIIRGDSLYYSTYTLLGICFFGDSQCREQSVFYLSSFYNLSLTHTYIDKENKLLEITKALFHFAKHAKRFKNKTSLPFKNSTYDELNIFLMSIVTESASALDVNCRLQCAELITALVKKCKYEKKDFDEIIVKLVSDNCSKVRNAIKCV